MKKTAVALSAILLIGSMGKPVSLVWADTGESHVESFVGSKDFSNGTVVKSMNTSKVVADLSISDTGIAECTVRVTGKVNATNISSSMKIQLYDKSKKTWVNVAQWSNSTDSSRMVFKKAYSLKARGNYRLCVTVNVWCGDKKETLNSITPQKVYYKIRMDE